MGRKQRGETLELGVLQQNELICAERVLWKQAQSESFPGEVTTLWQSRGSPEARHPTVAKSSSILKRWPFMDQNGILRMRGRIGAASWATFDTKFPIILHREHQVTFLISDWYHRHFRHANRETIINEIRQRFEIPKLRVLMATVGRNCMVCRIRGAKPQPPPLSLLPDARLAAFIRPFTYVGLDYFGPLYVRLGRSNVKRWIALFTCLTIRAIHLEVVHSLSTESCVMAVRRFVARRGAPAEIFTDNGTNFQGASRQLKEEIEQRNEKLTAIFTNANTRWNFNPPAAPHMGGVWERLVRSVKVAIDGISEAKRKPDDECLETVILETEAMINTRPLTYIPLESADQESLTPNHFLLGSSTGIKQRLTSLIDCRSTLRSSWKLVQLLTDEMWRRWIKEYTPVITRRSKWFEEAKEIKRGDLVLVVDETVRNQWIRGRIEQVILGKDGRVRQAVVRTSSGSVKRPVVKLALLDVAENGDPNRTRTGGDNHGPRVGGCNDELNTPRLDVNGSRRSS
ncbi:uncharacterized protein LOC131688063 [Topomyia yanbarensis]|uniref:uncharacterized protein LOC131688063 n=1 Tax=Topomyia yanbarensis TaxID=2498891 RepID=UPI00273C4781|nr:uncharacterized protein LOC131688063 [Topomyia yanbarensis]